LLLRVVEALCYRILDERMRLSSILCCLAAVAAATAKQEPRALAVGAALEQSTHLAVASIENEALAYPAQRIWRIDDQTSIATVGVAADARAVARAATVLCLEHRATYSAPLPPSRLARALAQRFAAAAAGDRSLGVDVVVAGAGAVASVSADGRARTGRAAVAGGAETSARRKLEDALVASLDAGDAPEDACAAALAAADLS
jgi:20S proteasome alpha/beta subunit